MVVIDALLSDWGTTSGKQLTSTYKYNLTTQDNRYVTTNLTSESFGAIVLTIHPQGMETTSYDPIMGTRTLPTAEGAEVLRRLNVLEAFNGTKFLQLAIQVDGSVQGETNSTNASSGGSEAGAAHRIHLTYTT